jgi:hypothetical protein
MKVEETTCWELANIDTWIRKIKGKKAKLVLETICVSFCYIFMMFWFTLES